MCVLMRWFCEPGAWAVAHDDGEKRTGVDEGTGGSWSVEESSGALILAPDAKKDFWRRTYYTPLLVKDDGPCLLACVPHGALATLEVGFTLRARRQFDQAGCVVRIDAERHVKAGIEFVDGAPRCSVVVTNGHSDWSTQPWAFDDASEEEGGGSANDPSGEPVRKFAEHFLVKMRRIPSTAVFHSVSSALTATKLLCFSITGRKRARCGSASTKRRGAASSWRSPARPAVSISCVSRI